MKNKVAIITGASSGIGRALAKKYAEQGWNLVIAARSESGLNKTKSLCKLKEDNILAVQMDVSIEDENQKLVAACIEKFGKLDLFIANAGITMKGLFQELSMEVFHKVMNTNYWGVVYGAKYAVPELLKSKGSFVGVSSVAGFKGLPGRTAYSASKHAVNGFIDTLRTENLKTGLHVLLACPGFTNTNTRKNALLPDGSIQGDTPREEGKMMQPETVAEKVFIAVERRKRKLVLTREGKLILLLNKLAPVFLDKQVYKSFAQEPNSPLPK